MEVRSALGPAITPAGGIYFRPRPPRASGAAAGATWMPPKLVMERDQALVLVGELAFHGPFPMTTSLGRTLTRKRDRKAAISRPTKIAFAESLARPSALDPIAGSLELPIERTTLFRFDSTGRPAWLPAP